MQVDADCVGQISYDYDEFCKDYGHPAGRMFTFEVTHRAVTYVYVWMRRISSRRGRAIDGGDAGAERR
jgi:hypothetical protein